MYICVYIYIHQCMAVGRIWGSFSCPSKEGSGRRTHEGLPMHPLGGRELYIVSRGWSLDWLLGVCLPPRYVYFPRFFSIAFFFFLLFPLSTPYFESRRFFDTFILSSFLSIVKLLGTLSREREEKKKELWFSFAFEREFFSTFPSLSRNPLVSVTFSYFPFLRPSLFSWHGAHSSLVVLRLTLDLAYWFMHLSLILLRFFIPLPAYANRTSVSSSSTHPSPPLIHQFVALNPLLQVSFTLASFPFAARLRSSRNKHTGIIILRCLAIS